MQTIVSLILLLFHIVILFCGHWWLVFDIINCNTNATVTIFENLGNFFTMTSEYCILSDLRRTKNFKHISSINQLERLDRICRIDYQDKPNCISITCFLRQQVEFYKKLSTIFYQKVLGLIDDNNRRLRFEQSRKSSTK